MSKTIKVKDTNEIVNITSKIDYEKMHEKVEIERKIYTETSISKTIGSINNQIYAFIDQYGKEPTFILISRELEILLSRQANLMNQHQMISIDRVFVELYLMFGFPCLVTPTLKDLEFEIR